MVCTMPTLRNLAARNLRLFLTTLAVLVGIGFVAGTLILNDAIGRTFNELLAQLTGNAFGIRSSWDMSGR
jgi:putative ABC transport system permease protein